MKTTNMKHFLNKANSKPSENQTKNYTHIINKLHSGQVQKNLSLRHEKKFKHTVSKCSVPFPQKTKCIHYKDQLVNQ